MLPSTYNFDVYNGAILYPKVLHDMNACGTMDVCASCHSALHAEKQPMDAIANFQYYVYDELPASVHQAFASMSLFDVMLVARA
jgi:hypothetical protein